MATHYRRFANGEKLSDAEALLIKNVAGVAFVGVFLNRCVAQFID